MATPNKKTQNTQSKVQVPATRQSAAIEQEKPSYLQELEKRGRTRTNDNFDSSDVSIPRIKLLQGLSEECQNFNEAKPGLFWHSGLDQSFGSEFIFDVVSRRKRYLLVAPLEDGQGILARSEDFETWLPPHGEFQIKIKGSKRPVTWKLAPTVAESGLDKWGSYNPEDPDSPPAATLFYEYLVLLPNNLDLGPVAISLTRSAIKKARKGLNDKILMHANAGRPMQAVVFKAKAVKEESKQGSFFNWQFEAAGFANEELFKKAYEMKDALSTFRIRDEERMVKEKEASVADNIKDY